MITQEVRNVNYALPAGVDLAHRLGVREGSRDGEVLRVPVPVCTVYSHPCERVLHHSWRDANPFFHLVEAMWMLAGRNTLKDLTPYVKRMGTYSDDGGKTQPGAYGHRWRRWFPDVGDEGGTFPTFDQLDWAVKRLRANPDDRRVVIQMWDGGSDPHAADAGSRDVPCNVTCLPWKDPEGRLNLTVFCRSNDLVMGAYGANAVHFSILLEYLAARVGLPVGQYWQISNNFHTYLRDKTDANACWPSDWAADPYVSGKVEPYPLFAEWDMKAKSLLADELRENQMQQDLLIFFEHGPAEAATKARWPFLRRVVVPLALAHQHWRNGTGIGRYDGALEIIEQCAASDWRLAAREWIERRMTKFIEAHPGDRRV